MRTLIAVAWMVISLSAMGAAPKASAPASPQAKFQEHMALALKGDAVAQLSVGNSYSLGRDGHSINHTEAVKWYRLSAEQGNASAQLNLGFAYDYGEGVDQDYKEAVRWYRLSAEQGKAFAQAALGFAYRNGHGVTQDYTEAVKWYRPAADQGNASAQYNLGLAYSNGQGVLQDNVYAYMWSTIGASNGSEIAAKNSDITAAKMTPSQLEKAQDLARACVKKNYKGC